MLENCRNARERWGGVSELIDRWLKERQNLLVHYCELSGEADFTRTEELGSRLERLCEVLLDYVSAGHFEVYEQLIREAREFNDGRIDGRMLSERDAKELYEQLSELGETLESRFEMEDFLIEHLHNAHADKLVSAS